MRTSLLDALDPGFRVRVGTDCVDRDGLHREARALIIPSGERGRIVETPARDPLEALVYIEAAWMAGAVALPSSRLAIPRLALDVSASRAQDLALVLATSGSTGAPRYAGFSLDAVVRSASRIARNLGLVRDDVIGVLQPCDHGFGLVGQVLAAGVVGACALGASRAFAKERVEVLVGARATVFAAVPFGLAQLLPHFDDLPARDRACVRQIGVAGGALGTRLAHALHETFPAAELVHQYGCTEAGPRLTAITSREPAFALGSVGRAIEGVRLRIDAPDADGIGEVLFATDTAMARYVDDEVATAATRVGTPDGVFLRTGDIGRLDESGCLYITGRTDEVVKLRGEKVSLDRVAKVAEDAGADHAIAVYVAPAADETDGAIHVVYEGPESLTLLRFVGRLPPGVLPRSLHRVDALPRLASGKIDRVAARASVTSAAPERSP